MDVVACLNAEVSKYLCSLLNLVIYRSSSENVDIEEESSSERKELNTEERETGAIKKEQVVNATI